MLGNDNAQADTTEPEAVESEKCCKQNGPLHIALERKGRAGKTATIIYGFTIDDSRVDEIASQLKRAIGCGGSARGGEILLQGDRIDAVRAFLSDKGFKVK